jgi:ABC-type methionine transport system ATPase subunit
MTDQCPMVKCCDLQVCVGGFQVIRNVTFDCCQGEWAVLTGRSGAGKTTLLRTINGLCPPSAGKVWALGSWIPGRSRSEAHRAWRSTGTVLQELALFSTRTAAANVEIGLRAAGYERKAAQREARDWLERLGLGDKAGEFPASLSGGERQRVAIARAIAHQPQLLILDEPTSHLDHGSARIVLAAIQELVQRGSTVVMASHREDEVEFAGACRIVLEDGYVKDVCGHV